MNTIYIQHPLPNKTDKEKASVPIVAITGNAKNYTEEEFKTAGFNDVLVKPLNFDRLVEVVNQLTDK
jgi:CheY-like chemotaxis protein